MNNLLKSKFFLGVMIVAFALVGASVASAYSHTVTLKLGSTGAQVMSLQQALNASGFVVATSGAGSPGMESTYFGTKTKAAVMAFQSAHGLTADGVVGAMTGAALGGAVSSGGTWPAGCTSGSGYSTTTGMACGGTSTVAGCTSTAGYSPTTGAKCDGSTTGGTSSGALSGGAGDLTLTSTSTDVEDSVKEGATENIFGVRAEADGSDVSINSIKVSFVNCDIGCAAADTTSSENLTHYVDTVSVYLGSEKVGSADVSDFTKDTGSPDEFSKTITLNGAVINDQDDAKLYVAVSAIDNIDSDDLDSATWGIKIGTVRFSDATGAILSADVGDFDTYAENDQFTFDDASTDDQIDLKSSSANPDDANVQVDADSKSDSTLALAFKLDVADDSSDVDVTAMTFEVAIVNLDTDNDADITAETIAGGSDLSLVDSVDVKIGGNTYTADLDDASVTIDADGDGTATYTADIDDLTISAGDVEEGKVYVVFNKADDYNQDQVTTQLSIAQADISVETSEGEFSVTGTDQTGAILTPSLSGATVEVTDTSHSQNDAATLGTFTFEVTVTADGADVDVDAAAIVETILGPDATPTANDLTVVNIDGDATENGANDYTVADGDSNTFSISYALNPDTNGTYYIRLDSIDGVIVDETAGPETLVL